MTAYPWLGRACLWLGLLWTLPGHALDPTRQYYQYQYLELPAEAGLDHGVYAVAQDHAGFLWLATDQGLVRFDGHDSEIFRAIDHAGLISNRITNLWTTRSGDLLIASKQGMSRYRDGQFESIVGGNKWSAYIRAMAQTDDGVIWLGSAKGLFRWHDDQLDAVFSDRIGGIQALVAHGDRLLVGSDGLVFSIEEQAVTPIFLPPPLTEQTVTDLAVHNDQVWGVTKTGLFHLQDDLAVHVDRPELEGVVAERLLVDRDQTLWFYGRLSIGRFLPNGKIEVPENSLDSLGMGVEMAQLFEDRDGRIWMASPIWQLGALFDAPVRRISFSEGLLSATIQAVGTDADGHALLVTPAGINRLVDERSEVVFESDAFAATPARCLLADARGRLWIGTSKGLQLFDVASETLTQVENVDPVPVNALALDPRDPDSLWIGTDLGLLNLRAGRVSELPATTGVAVESLFFDRRGTLWVGTETGLVSMGEDTLTLHASELPASLDAVLDITQLASGQILATTRNHGLIASTPDGWQQYTERQGLPKSSITDIELYGNQAWLISSAGLFRFDAQQIHNRARQLDVRAIISLDNYRPLHVDLCCSGERDSAAAQDSGKLIATTHDGIMQMDMTRPDAQLPQPRPYIRAVTTNDQTTLHWDSRPIVLSSHTDRIKIDYSALSLDQAGRLVFRYRLRGNDDTWLNMGTARTAHLANLPVGDFTFELQASVLPGIWSQTSSQLRIQRTPGLTETLAFRIALWIAPVALVAALLWLRSAVARRRHRMLELRIQERTRRLRSVNEELESRNQALRRVSETDALTGLLNRRYFDMRKSEDELDASLSDQGVLIMIDIDHFKRINDTWGHSAGDAVLCQFADVLRAATRESDVVARWGGEEFMLLCRCQEAHAPFLLDRIVHAVRDHAFTLDNGDHINVHSSLGAVLYPLWPGHSMDDRLGVLLELADAALYRVKSCGRDGWALLGGATAPQRNVRIKRAGPLLSALVADDHLTWTASRETINPDAAMPSAANG